MQDSGTLNDEKRAKLVHPGEGPSSRTSKASGILKRARLSLLALILVAASFAWGVAYARYYVFPHSLVSNLTNLFQESENHIPIADSASGGVSIRRPSTFDLLQTLGYVGTSTVSSARGSGASIIDAKRIQPGFNLYTIGHADAAFLIDETGALIHEWTLPRDQIWWDSPLAERQRFVGIRSAVVLPDLSLLAIYDYLGLIRLDRNSNPVWIVRNGAHHDFWLTPDHQIYLLSHRLEEIPEIRPGHPVVVDTVTVLDMSGRTTAEYSLVELMQNSPFSFLLPAVNDLETDVPVDLLHTNSIQVFDGSLASLDPRLFAKGNVLLSLRNISTLIIADLEASEVLWVWGPSNISFQHSARLLATGTILLFDNGLDWSTVLEIDPLNFDRIWSWQGAGATRLNSRIYGSCRRLPNGNTLIVDSMQARAFEVTSDGNLVWSFLTPPLDDGRVPVLYDLRRYDRSYFNGLKASD